MILGSEPTMLRKYITDTYGEVIYKKTTQIQRMKRQAASSKCRWIFLSRCAANNIIPKSFRTRPTLRTRKGGAITEKYDQKMLRTTRDSVKQQYHTYLRKINEMNGQVKETMSEEDFKKIDFDAVFDEVMWMNPRCSHQLLER